MLMDEATESSVSSNMCELTSNSRGSAVIDMLRELGRIDVPHSGDCALANVMGYQLYLNLRQLYETQRLDMLRKRAEESLIRGRAREGL